MDLSKVAQILSAIPILNLLPLISDFAGYLPKAYEDLTPEQKANMAAKAMKYLAK